MQYINFLFFQMQVVFQSRDYNALTMTILAMSSLLYPLEYMFPVIPLLPSCMNNAEQVGIQGVIVSSMGSAVH